MRLPTRTMLTHETWIVLSTGVIWNYCNYFCLVQYCWWLTNEAYIPRILWLILHFQRQKYKNWILSPQFVNVLICNDSFRLTGRSCWREWNHWTGSCWRFFVQARNSITIWMQKTGMFAETLRDNWVVLAMRIRSAVHTMGYQKSPCTAVNRRPKNRMYCRWS